MTGIAGLMTRDGEAPPSEVLRAMAAALAHRGPDGDGHYRSGDLGMVQTQLAITDLATGDQPLYEPAGAALIADAEIYNDEELRRGLSEVEFATRSDCEAPLHLYRRHGLDFVGRLRGIYAIALHDPAEGRLVLARDPFGAKPLYFAETARLFAFASEPETLLMAGIVPRRLAAPARNELLQMQFTTGREMIFAGINRVLPGETIVVSRGRIVERRLREALPSGPPLVVSEDEALECLDAALRDSVGIRLRSEVPLGLFLSGGVDSTAILATMARLAEQRLRAFTIGYIDGDNSDERPAASLAAAAVGVEHVEVAFEEADFWRLLPQLAANVDDPAADYAMLPLYKLAGIAREAGVKAILSGEGGDELFAGYGRYRSVMRPWWAGGRMPRARGVLDELGILRGEIAGWRDGIAAAEARSATAGRSRLQVAQAVDCADWLPNDLLVKLDRCLMTKGIQARAPLLDAELAALAFRLPDDLKIRRGQGKWLLRRWLAQRLPAAQPLARKRGFTVPVTRWIAKHANRIGPLVAASEGVRELCHADGVRRAFAAAGHRRPGRAAWTLLFYALWHRRHIEGRDLPPDTIEALAES
ncbi:MAG TPA: asparagine synthase (glutamine-hydrolyzing) [Stellaceae bacterium]|jgi:asparagine synthase (glutamine-hydrolysing)|nr:asparagine synthase (glutamine-hydrolyzing) [Stellaceae bacterium]